MSMESRLNVSAFCVDRVEQRHLKAFFTRQPTTSIAIPTRHLGRYCEWHIRVTGTEACHMD